MPARPTDPRQFLPLKPLLFQILLVLLEEERHGWSIVREVERRAGDGRRILPGNLYRTLREMQSHGLLEESDERPDPEFDDERRRYYKVTPLGRATARAEAHRLQGLVGEAHALKLLSIRKR